MKKLLGLSILMNFMAALTKPGTVTPRGYFSENTDDEPIIHKRRLSKEEETARHNDILAEHGVKRFTIKGVTVMAINEKNAKRKVEKILAAKKQEPVAQ